MFKRGLADVGKSSGKSNNQNRTFDFWLEYGTYADIIFLDSYENVPFDVVHPLFFDNNQHLISCGRADGDDCPVCQYVESFPKGTKDLPYARDMAFFTIIDLRPYTKDDGTEIPVTKKLLKASKNTCKLIRREMEMSGIEELYGTLWKVGRGEEAMPKPAAVGDMYRYSRKADLDKLVEQVGDDAILEPFSIEALNEIVIRDAEKIQETFGRYLELKGGSAPKKASGFSGTKLNI